MLEQIENEKDILKEINGEKPILYETYDYPVEKMNDQDFEVLTCSFFNHSEVLKKKYNFKIANLIKGGSDKGRDVICIDFKGKTNSIIQCKHSVDPRKNYSKTSAYDEILKTILYIYLEPKLVKDGNFNYILVISHKIKEDVKNSVEKDFYNDVMEKDSALRNKIKKLKDPHKGYVKIGKGIEKLTSEVLENIRKIAKRMVIYTEKNENIQSYISEIPDEIKEKFFKMKIVVEKNKDVFSMKNMNFEDINSDEIKRCENERFYKKLVEIELENRFKCDAILDYYKKLEWHIELHEDDPVGLEPSLEEYEKEILKKESNERQNYKDKLILKDVVINEESSIKRKLHSKIYYRKFVSSIDEKVNVRNLPETPSSFTRGTCHDLVNIKKISNWKLCEEED